MGKTLTKVLRPGVMRLLYFMGARKVQYYFMVSNMFKFVMFADDTIYFIPWKTLWPTGK